MKTKLLLLFLLTTIFSWGQYTGTGTFTQITTTTELTDGYYVLIANGTTNQGMSNTYVSPTFLSPASLTLTTGTLVNPSISNVWKIQTNGASKTIYNEAITSYVSYTGATNNVQLLATATTNNQKWNFTVTTGVFSITNAALTTRLLQYNSASPRFACYTGSQSNIKLYKLAGNTVTFDANGGTGTMANQTASSATALTSNAFTRAGFTFAGWATTAGGAVAYTNGASYPFTANATLYAVWTPNNNTITFDANGGTGTMVTQTIATNLTANLNTNTFTRSGFTFAGWSTTAGGAVAYTNGASYTMGTANVTLYAQWTANSYTITFDGNGFTGGATSTQTLTTNATANLTLNGFTRTGYTFAGWATTAGGTVAFADGASYTMGTANVTLYAQWSVFTGPCFSENFASITGGNNTATSGSSTAWTGNTSFPTITNAYQAGGAVKLGTGSASGSITSTTLSSVSGDVTVSIDVKGWTTVEGDLRVTLNGQIQTQTYTAVMASASFETKTFTFLNVPSNATLIIATTAGRAFIDNIILTCAAATPRPEINLQGNATDILSGDTITSTTDGTDFGATDVTSGLVSKTFTIQNTGTANLNLTGTPIVAISGANASDFSVTTQPSATSIAGSSSLTFVVAFNPASVGLKTATISIANDDISGSENPYTFSIQGTGTNPAITSSITTLSGFTYLQGSGPSTNQTFTVSGTNLTANLVVTASTDYEINTAATGTFLSSISLTPVSGSVATTTIYIRLKAGLIAGTYNETCSVTTTNATTISITCNGTVTAPAPEINLQGGSTPTTILSGDTTPSTTDGTNFGSTDITTGSVVKTFTIQNTGNANLSLTGTPIVAISGANASDFSVTTYPSTPIASASSTTFQVTFDPASIGLKTATIAIANDDATGSENPYTFSIQGTGITPTITTSLTLLTGFTYVEGFGPSTNQTYTVSGTNLTANIVLTAPTDYEINTAATGTFLSTISLTPTSGSVATTTIYVRLKAGLLVGNYNLENITLTSTNATSVLIACSGNVTTPAPEIDVERSTLATIPSGSAANSGFDTIFAAQTIGNTAASPKTYIIKNQGTAGLTVTAISSNSSEFAIGSGLTFPLSIAIGASTTFTVAFTPNTSGIRNGTITLVNDDSNENPYTFGVQGTGNCGTYTNVLTPASGPVGTEVIITASTGNLNGASVTFNGVVAFPTQLSATQLSVTVPSGSTTGSVVTLNAQGCSVSTIFTVINNDITSCQAGSSGGGSAPSTPTDLFISKVTDSNIGALTYIQIYNATGTTKNISDYSVKFYNNGSTTVTSTLALTGGTIASGQTFVLAVGATATPTTANTCSGANDASNGTSANQINTTISGVNFNGTTNNDGHDHIRLYNGATYIDAWGVSGDQTWASSMNLGGKGAGFVRNNTATVPNTTYTNADWAISDWATCADENYTDINNYVFSVAVPPTITVQPTFGVSCSIQLTVEASEGFNEASDTQELTYQWYAVAPLSASWVALTDLGIYSGTTTANLTISSTVGVDGYQYYCQVRENGATCYQASNAVKVTYVNTATTWNGLGWTNSAPTATSVVTFEANYNITSDFNACSIYVTNNAAITVNSSIDVNLYGAIVVDSGSSFTMANNANLMQTTNAVNSGTIILNRETSLLKRLDYTLWSSPVTGSQTLKQFSPNTSSGRYYVYNTALNFYNSIDPNATTFAEAKSYLIRVPNNHSSTTPTVWNAVFNGTPNNGLKSFTVLTSGYNAIGNPYPSRLNVHDFIDANPSIDGTLYLWRKTNDSQQTSYATLTKLAYVKNFATGGDTGTGFFATGNESNWVLNIGQGFIVNTSNTSPISFNNQMRRSSNANQFFKNSQTNTSNLYWLNLTSTTDLFSQMAIGYTSDTTLGFDRGFDGKNINPEYYLSSLIGSDEYTIQGRPEFQESDVVYLSYKVPTAGQYTIDLDSASGLFSNYGQSIFLKDNLTNTLTDLKNQSYNFTSDLGVFSNRFEIHYQNSLSNPSSEINENTIKVFKENESVVIDSGRKEMSAVKIYDIRGRLLIDKTELNSNKTKINLFGSNEVLLVNIIFTDGHKLIKKIVL